MNETEYINCRRKQAEELTALFNKSIAGHRIVENRIVFSCFEGDGGFCCNPRYIAEELIKRGGYEIVWLTHEPALHMFPKEIHVVKDTIENQVYWLSTAQMWIDNYRKPWGTVKRDGQIYIQTWHASMGFKAVGLYRENKFPEIARLISEADSMLIDYMLSNSEYCDSIYPKKLLYSGKTFRSGSPRCDCLIKKKNELHIKIRKQYGLPQDARLVIYAPTFRGGTQKDAKEVFFEMPSLDFEKIKNSFVYKFGGEWFVLLRLHPQLAAKYSKMQIRNTTDHIIDVSMHEDMSELLGSSNVLITDYSSCAFDALFAHIPVFLYAVDVQEYVKNRGKFMWTKDQLPFSVAETDDELIHNIAKYDQDSYIKKADIFMKKHGVVENGDASRTVADKIEELLKKG